MKPKRIILVRHGESQGNLDKNIYKKIPDYALDLTDKGKEQAFIAGQEIAKIIQGESAGFYISPHWRTRRTYQHIARSIKPHFLYEDPRLREQEWSGKLRNSDADYYKKVEKERDEYGRFYFRLDSGESCADVYDRVSDVLNTVNRDFEKPNFPDNCIFVNHGLTMRVFLMRFFHYSIEKFDSLANPKNCEYWILQKNESNRYDLISEPRLYKNPTHEYQFDWTKL